jgi:FkbM family methyltransferase
MDIVNGKRTIRIADKHWYYEQDMKEYFDTYFGAVSSSNSLVDFSKPAIHRYRYNNLEFLLPSLPEEPQAVLSYFKHTSGGPLAFDVGAYCGLSTYELSKRFDHVVAFEPDPLNRACLQFNISFHDLKNITVVPMAIAANSGVLKFHSEGALGSCVVDALPGPAIERGTTVEVDSISLPMACALHGTPTFISMDIEGVETSVLAASTELLRRGKISFAIDTNHRREYGWTFSAVEAILRSCGYQTETEKPGGMYTTWGWKE